jgi:Ca2+-binding EF-hand superfamily protein
MKAMFRIYYSPLETKFKLVFDMYDFDNDGVVTREDLHLVLSHIPLCVRLNSCK